MEKWQEDAGWSEEQARLYDEEFRRVQTLLKPRADAIRESRRISREDLQIIVNV